MKHLTFLYYLFFTSFVCVLITSAPCMGQVVCPGSYGGHLQGITTDKTKAIYWSFTTDLVKTDAKGNLLVKVSVPSHHGDLTCHDGKIYVAVNLGKFNREEGHARSWIYVYDAKKLKLLSKHSTPEVVHGAGGIAYHKNKFFIVGVEDTKTHPERIFLKTKGESAEFEEKDVRQNSSSGRNVV